MRQEMYREVLKVSQKSRKSLVNVRGISKDEDLLNNSYLQQEDTEGLVFLETETQFYILTYEEELENLQELQVTLQMVRQCRERYAGEMQIPDLRLQL